MTNLVTVGSNAQCFHDAITGVTVCKGEIVELRASQYKSPRIRQALSTGHLVLVQDKEEVKINTPKEIEKLDKKVQKDYNKGTTIEKISSYVTLEQAKALAEIHEVTVDEDDTVISILEAILVEEK